MRTQPAKSRKMCRFWMGCLCPDCSTSTLRLYSSFPRRSATKKSLQTQHIANASQGQFCHSYCTYCFRWAQFTAVGSDQQFKSNSAQALRDYIARHPLVTDVLLTGGDPMVMLSKTLRKYIIPLLRDRQTENLTTIRIGTKSLAYWPLRYISDPDSKDLLDLFADISRSGKHLTLQAHFSHPRELQTTAVQEAIRLIRMTGAQIRCQAPLIRHVNDDAETWRELCTLETRLGLIPYYM